LSWPSHLEIKLYQHFWDILPNSENSPDSLGSSPDSLGWPGYSGISPGFSGVYPGTAVNPEVPSLQPGSSGFKWVKIFTSKILGNFHGYKVPKLLWMFKKLELTFISGKYTQKSSQVRGVLWKPEVPVFKSGSSGFQQLYHYLARDLPFHPSFTLSHTARHFPVRERRFCGDSRIWPRFLRGKGGLLVISIQRFRIHPPESISNPSHHEQRYKIIPFARSLYLGLICLIPLVEHLHLDHRWYP